MKRQGRNKRIKCKECAAYGIFNYPFGDKSKPRLNWRREPYSKCKLCKKRRWIKDKVTKNEY